MEEKEIHLDKIVHINASPEFLNNPESIAMLNEMVGKAYNMVNCMELNCTKIATVDYNGHGHMVCESHYDSLTRYFEEEYD